MARSTARKRKRKGAKWPLALGITAAALALLAALFLGGVLRVNTLDAQRYPVWGVDVSEYQGGIDWVRLREQGLGFAFIRATEGSGYTDATFAANWQGAHEAGIPAGAYHFFSFDSPGETQAASFIATVPRGGALPPVVDVEFYGAHKRTRPEAEAVRAELDAMLTALEAYYGQRPILYATNSAYSEYLAGHYEDHDIWIREVYLWPSLPDARNHTFWQYTDRGRLDGYDGEEKYIDLNVFIGSEAEWAAYLLHAAA